MKKYFALLIIIVFKTTTAQVSDFKSVDFTRADNTAKLYQGASLNNLPILAQNLTSSLTTDVEKFRAIFFWVCNNIKGDYLQGEKIIRKRKKYRSNNLAYLKWNAKQKKITFNKLLKYKKTMCTGYAYLIKELCFLANIECQIVNGYGRTVMTNVKDLELANHSWNAVKLNNKWYLCDATWSSGYIQDEVFVKEYTLGYFLTDPELFTKNHYPIQKKWLLNDTLKNSNFVPSPLVYIETFEHKIITTNPKLMEVNTKKNEVINFAFKALKTVDEDSISLIHFSGDDEKIFPIYDIKNVNGLISFKHQFKSRGFYDVHLKINDDIVATYTVEVTKI